MTSRASVNVTPARNSERHGDGRGERRPRARSFSTAETGLRWHGTRHLAPRMSVFSLCITRGYTPIPERAARLREIICHASSSHKNGQGGA